MKTLTYKEKWIIALTNKIEWARVVKKDILDHSDIRFTQTNLYLNDLEYNIRRMCNDRYKINSMNTRDFVPKRFISSELGHLYLSYPDIYKDIYKTYERKHKI
jgi:hypothetical protein